MQGVKIDKRERLERPGDDDKRRAISCRVVQQSLETKGETEHLI